jgi:asparagine synthase (glutamine-hydrolysing)
MCGICGAVGIDRPSMLEEMAACQTHRGPDSTGTYRDDAAMLASQRLRVIDLDSGDQPISNEDGDVVVVYNGEVYNFRGLRDKLESAGHRFTTATDTEVIVHGYEEWGSNVFGRLNGMFVVALWDATRERLLLARDRAGIKPAYYASTGDGLLFASEPKGILRSGLVDPAVDGQALEYFLQLRYSPSHTTLFEGIDTVLPGTYLDIRWRDDTWSIEEHEYWNPVSAMGEPPADPASAVHDALRRAVRRQLVSDVPVGFYLSGGLDTSSVVAMASELTDEPIHTFCMGFADQAWDEREDAQAVADHFGTHHHEILIEDAFMRDFPRMIWHADEPKRNLYPYYVAEEMRNHVTVALGGLGADELFGGYVYRYNQLLELEALRETGSAATTRPYGETATWIAERLRGADLEDIDGGFVDLNLRANLDDPETIYVLLNSTDVIGDIGLFRDRVFGDRLPDDFTPSTWIAGRPTASAGDGLVEQALGWDFSVKLPNDFLLVEDRMSMAHSLESRVPFLDNELIGLSFSIPASEKFYDGTADPSVGKAVLREAMRPKLPDAVFEKSKQGFTMPTYRFARDELLPHAQSILDDPYIVREGLVNPNYHSTLLDRQPSDDLTPHYKVLWKLVALEIWYQMYVVEGASGPRAIEHYYT